MWTFDLKFKILEHNYWLQMLLDDEEMLVSQQKNTGSFLL